MELVRKSINFRYVSSQDIFYKCKMPLGGGRLDGSYIYVISPRAKYYGFKIENRDKFTCFLPGPDV